MSKKQVLRYFRTIARENDIVIDSKKPVWNIAVDLINRVRYADYVTQHKGEFKYAYDNEDEPKKLGKTGIRRSKVSVLNGVTEIDVALQSDFDLTEQALEQLFDDDISEVSQEQESNIIDTNFEDNVTGENKDTGVSPIDFKAFGDLFDSSFSVDAPVENEQESQIHNVTALTEGAFDETLDLEPIITQEQGSAEGHKPLSSREIINGALDLFEFDFEVSDYTPIVEGPKELPYSLYDDEAVDLSSDVESMDTTNEQDDTGVEQGITGADDSTTDVLWDNDTQLEQIPHNNDLDTVVTDDEEADTEFVSDNSDDYEYSAETYTDSETQEFDEIDDDTDDGTDDGEGTVIRHRRIKSDTKNAAALLDSVNNDKLYDEVSSNLDIDTDILGILSGDYDDVEDSSTVDNLDPFLATTANGLDTDEPTADIEIEGNVLTGRLNRKRRHPRSRECDSSTFGFSSAGTMDNGVLASNYCMLDIGDNVDISNNGMGALTIGDTLADTFDDIGVAAQTLCGFDVSVAVSNEIIPTMDLVQAVVKVAEAVENFGKGIVGGVKKIFGAIKDGFTSNGSADNADIADEDYEEQPESIGYNAVAEQVGTSSVNTLSELYDLFGFAPEVTNNRVSANSNTVIAESDTGVGYDEQATTSDYDEYIGDFTDDELSEDTGTDNEWSDDLSAGEWDETDNGVVIAEDYANNDSDVSGDTPQTFSFDDF